MVATHWYKAVPSMFMVAPSGSMKRVTRLSTLLFSSMQRNVTGRVAVLKKKLNIEFIFIEYINFWPLPEG